jgi:SAM-dependent methyltransferase
MFQILKNKIKLCITIVNDLMIIFSAYYYKYRAINKGLIGVKFDTFGRNLGWKIIKNNNYSIGKMLIMHPVNIVRYFEFQFVYESNNWLNCHKLLDISSPRMFALYVADNHPHINYNYINPDVKDTEETIKVLTASPKPFNNLVLANEDATKLNYPDSYFDTIISISVIEHIPNNGDIEALQEMWRVLSIGGNLIITVPFMPNYFEEYLNFDEYGLYSSNSEGKYFGSRYYDVHSLKHRVFETIGKNPDKINVFGEIETGTFFKYREREWNTGILEYIKDPYYIANEYKLFEKLDDIPGLAVIGLVFKK